MPRPTVLALDIGTSSVRASIYDAALNPAAAAQLKYKWHEYPDGRVELDPRRLERLVMQAIDGVLDDHGPIDAVVSASFWHSLLAVDRHNEPLTPLIPWSDGRSGREVEELRELVDERRVHARTGCRLHTSYWPARWLWFQRHERRLFARTARWLTFIEWLERRWLGRDGVSISQASGSGVLNQDRCAWDTLVTKACRVDPRTLAPIVDTDDRAGELRPALARRWPALARARWIPGIGDGAANNVGAGCVTRGRAALMVGTSGAIRVLWEPAKGERVKTGFGLWRYRLDRRRVLVGGALSNGGNARELILGLFRAPENADARAAAMAPDSHGLTVLPFFAGTRSPDYLPDARAVVAGLSIATTPAQVLRATMEATAFSFGRVLAELREMVPVREIVAAGGALERSTAWVQILSDVLGRAIAVSSQHELTSRGAAAIAFEQLGTFEVGRLRPETSRTIDPDVRHRRLYAAAFARHMALLKTYRRLRPTLEATRPTTEG